MLLTRLEKLLLLCIGLALLGLAASRVAAWDLFWQLQSGRYMLETKSFIRHDIFSLAADAPRFEHCWLHDLIFYGTHALFGYAGLSLLKGVLVLATGVVLVAVARVRGSSWTAIVLVSPAAVFFTFVSWQDRPQLWTFLLFALFLLLLERDRQHGGRSVWLLIPLMVLWSNLHGGAVLGFPLLAAYLVGCGGERLLGRHAEGAADCRRLLGVAVLLALASLATPYGYAVLKTLAIAPKFGKSFGTLEQAYNYDWQSTPFLQNRAMQAAAAISALALALGRRRFLLSDLLLLAGLTFMGLKLNRHGPFVYFAMAALLPAYVDAAGRSRAESLRPATAQAMRGAVLLLAVGLLVWVARPAWKANGFFDLGLRQWQFPVQSAEFVRQQKLPGQLFNSYDIGGYLMWTLYPEHLVFWDGRQDSPEMFNQGLRVMYNDDWQQVLDRYRVNTVLTSAIADTSGARWPLVDRLRGSDQWALVFTDDWSLVFVRRESVEPVWLQAHEQPKSRIDDTILAAAPRVFAVNPWCYSAWWEVTRIQMARKDYPGAAVALDKYLTHAPRDRWVPEAGLYYKLLAPMMAK